MGLSAERCLYLLGRRSGWLPFASACRSYAKPSINYSSTIKLPRTELKVAPPHDLSAILNKCVYECYQWQSENLSGDPLILHDGPPYANGDLHLGHALNKILKDIILRYNVLQKRKVSYIPGSDCHGLPIELKVQELARKSKQRDSRQMDIRSEARKFADKTVLEQMDEIKSWAVMGDWENRWRTMDLEYEIRQLEVFLEMVKKGMIYRQIRPVYWSPSSHTALAEAELEYRDDHQSLAVYAKFPLVNLGSKGFYSTLSVGKLKGLVSENEKVYATIWTTTPWTIPANRAIAFNPALTYVLASSLNGDKILVVERKDDSNASDSRFWDSSADCPRISGEDLIDCEYQHPLTSEQYPFVPAQYVTAESGTGLVHCAPGHGAEDYGLFAKVGFEPYSPVDDAGKFIADPSLPESLHGLNVLAEGNESVLKLLAEKGASIKSHPYVHKYPYDWRTKKPVIVRSTWQWFANVESIKEDATRALQGIKMVPESGLARLTSFVQGRSEWCISRQRRWGVPIPALYDLDTGEVLLTPDTIQYIISVIKQKGTDAWFSDDPTNQDWIPHHHRHRNLYRGSDTMDVWFDSGTSWSMLPSPTPTAPKRADIYLEGTDQHRGWFQSSLLTSVATQAVSPFKTLITHGFVLDEHGRKMSKSEGNVISPTDVVRERWKKGTVGVDGLRLWVASTDYTTDVAVGKVGLQNVAVVMAKFRATIRYILGTLDGMEKWSVEYKDLSILDRFALRQVAEINSTVKKCFEAFEFVKAVQAIKVYTSTYISRGYIDQHKDILYCDSIESPRRKATLYVLSQILFNYLSMLYPIIPMTIEEAWIHVPAALKREDAMYKVGWFQPSKEWFRPSLAEEMALFDSLTESVLQGLEQARQQGLIGSSLDADLLICTRQGGDYERFLTSNNAELATMFQVSNVKIVHDLPTGIDGWRIRMGNGKDWELMIVRPEKFKCPRCWSYTADKEDGLCGRCFDVIEYMPETLEERLQEQSSEQ